MVQIRLYGDDFPYLLIFIIIFAIGLVSLYFFRLSVRYQPKITPPAIQKASMVIGTGMVCSDVLGCSPGLQCYNGRCLAPIGNKCNTLYDCVSTAKACNGVCVSTNDAGELGSRCPQNSIGYCNANYDCLQATSTTYKCLIPDNEYGCKISDDCSFNYRCISNKCVPSKNPGEACTSNAECGGEDRCNGGYCEPPSIQPGNLGAYCYGTGRENETALCGNNLTCNISQDFSPVNYVGYCVNSSSISPIGGRCNINLGCISPGFCSNGICVMPSDTNNCGVGTSGFCIPGYQCDSLPNGGGICVGEENSSCSYNAQCVTNQCSNNIVYSINSSVLPPAFPTQTKIIDLVEPIGGKVAYYRPSPTENVRAISYGISGSEEKAIYYTGTNIFVIGFQIDGVDNPIKQIITTVAGKMIFLFRVPALGPQAAFDSFLVFDLPTSDIVINVTRSNISQFSLNIGTGTLSIDVINSIFYTPIEDKILFAALDGVSGNTYITYTGYGVYPNNNFIITPNFVSLFGNVTFFGSYFDSVNPSAAWWQNIVYLSNKTLKFVGSYILSYDIDLSSDPTGFGYTSSFSNQTSNMSLYIGGDTQLMKVMIISRNYSSYLLAGNYHPGDLTQDYYNSQILFLNSGECVQI